MFDDARQTARPRVGGHENGDQRRQRRRIEERPVASAGRTQGAEAHVIAAPVCGRAVARKPVAMFSGGAGDAGGRPDRCGDAPL